MNGIIKKYLPYVLIIFAVFLLVPAIFLIPSLRGFQGIGYYFIMLLTPVACAAVYCAKHGLDFLFALIAPIAFMFTMLIYAGGFANFTNIVLLLVYLIAGIFGLFLGDLAFGSERRKREKSEQQAVEDLLMQAKRRDEQEIKKMTAEAESSKKQQPARQQNRQKGGTRYKNNRQRPKHTAPEASAATAAKKSDDDFDYEKYLSDIDKLLDESGSSDY